MWTELVLISSEWPSSVWVLLQEWFRVMNYPGLSNFFRTPVNIRRSNNAMLKSAIAFCHSRLAIYPGLANDHPWDNYRFCFVVECTARWSIMYVASVPVRNARLRRVFVLSIIAAFATHQWTSAVLDGRCIHKFIMPSSRTETESVALFTKPAKTDRLHDFENCICLWTEPKPRCFATFRRHRRSPLAAAFDINAHVIICCVSQWLRK